MPKHDHFTLTADIIHDTVKAQCACGWATQTVRFDDFDKSVDIENWAKYMWKLHLNNVYGKEAKATTLEELEERVRSLEAKVADLSDRLRAVGITLGNW